MPAYYVPPHRKRERDVDELGGAASSAYQQEAWQALSRTITGIINRVSADTLAQSATELFRENIVRGRGLLARSVLRTQQVDPDLTSVLAALVSRVNRELPHVVLLLCKRLVVHWNRAHTRKDWRYLANVNKFVSWLYIFEVIDVRLVYQILLAHLSAGTASEDDDVEAAAQVFRETFRAMSQRARGEFYAQVLTPFRDLLAMDDAALGSLSARAQAVLEGCLKEMQQWERVKDEQEVIPPELVLFDLHEQTTHELDLETRYNTEEQLDRFVYDAQYEEHEAQYEVARRAILGDDWERELLEQAAAAEEEKENDDDKGDEGETTMAVVEGPTTGAAASAVAAPDSRKTLISEEERQVRKAVYMALRSSVRADEAVHKILKEMKPQTERTICFMVIEGCCEERTFRRLYSMAAERLCKSNGRFQTFFIEAFHARYAGAADLSVKQIEYTCRIFSHLLRTDAIYWGRGLVVLDIVRNDESQRLFIQYLLQSLVEEMGMSALLARLQRDDEVRQATRKLFPLDADVAVLEASINLYAAMNLASLAAELRAELARRTDAVQSHRASSA